MLTEVELGGLVRGGRGGSMASGLAGGKPEVRERVGVRGNQGFRK